MGSLAQECARLRKPLRCGVCETSRNDASASARSLLKTGFVMRSGFSLIETVVVLVVIGLLAAVAVPSIGQWAANQRLKTSARIVATAFSYARSEATRTGNIHMVLFQEDAQGNTLTGSPILVVDDGRPGTQNCVINGGEPRQEFQLESGVSFGLTHASS